MRARLVGVALTAAAACSPTEPRAPLGPAPRPETGEAAVGNAGADPAPPAGDPDAEQPGTTLDDGFDSPEAPVEGSPIREHPLAHLDDEELAERLKNDPASLGSMSVGRPNGGRLFNPVQMPDGARWKRVSPDHAWGTRETIENLIHGINTVDRELPGGPRLHIGHISARNGGPLSPHVSHQAGRDVDIGYYYLDGEKWYARAHAGNLDVRRTWLLIRTFITDTDVDLILIDHSIQRLLREHAERIGEDRSWLDGVFKGRAGKRPPLIRHARGHATHLHVRYFNPIAQETGRRCYAALVEQGLIDPPRQYVMHRVRKGETLSALARRYGTTVRAIQRLNGLKSTLIQARVSYKIPSLRPIHSSTEPITIPRRLLPPEEPTAPLDRSAREGTGKP